MAFTFGRCVVDFRWFAGVTLTHFVDGNDTETVGYVRPQAEDNTILVSFYSLQLFPTPPYQTLVLKLNNVLCKNKMKV